MKVRHKGSSGSDKVEIQMTPMIDIVFQLLVFFILTFRVVAQEGDFNIRMPLMGAPQESIDQAEKTTLNVRLMADPASGDLTQLTLDGAVMTPSPPQIPTRFAALHNAIRKRIDDGGGPNAAAMMEVQFECDYKLNYENVISAITAVSGYKSSSGSDAKIVKLIEQIKFAPPRNKPK
jgi:biopolymer transport protein ExbD